MRIFLFENVIYYGVAERKIDGFLAQWKQNPALEMDFFVRDADTLIPVEVKSKDGATASLNHLIDWPSFPDISYGVKFGIYLQGRD